MGENILLGLAVIVILGVLAQWIAWRVHLPSILLLLISGYLAGPVTGFVNPDEIFGKALAPLVSLAVAIILFEGGLSLKFSEFRQVGAVVTSLLSVGVLATWIVTAGTAHWLLGMSLELSILIGAILVVTGPTVIIPLLRHVRPIGNAGPILKWEGIVIDPIGAVLSVLVFEVVIVTELSKAWDHALRGVTQTLLFGGGLGVLGAFLLVLLLKKYWVPDFLHNAVSLMIALGVYAGSNHFQTEAGLLGVTVMGIVLANQRWVTIKHIVEFKENLRILLISNLFVVLAARLKPSDVSYISAESLAFLAIMILFTRPAAVFLSTIGSRVRMREKLFLAAVAPRGIVSASISALFAIRLVERGYVGAEELVPITFLVITGTVAVYGLSAFPLARALNLTEPYQSGCLIVGAHRWAREIAKALTGERVRVILADVNWENVSSARIEGLEAYYGNVLSETAEEEMSLNGIGKLLALTPNDEVNSLATLHFTDLFGRKEVYRLVVGYKEGEPKMVLPRELCGRPLFGSGVTFSLLSERFDRGAIIKKTKVTKEFDFKKLKETHGEDLMPLFIIGENREVTVCTADTKPIPKPGQTVISLVGGSSP